MQLKEKQKNKKKRTHKLVNTNFIFKCVLGIILIGIVLNFVSAFPCMDLNCDLNISINVSDTTTSTDYHSSSGGGGRKIVIVTNKTTSLETNQTIQSDNLSENEYKSPSQLFDIKLELDSATINNVSELYSVIRFESFGNVPTFVDLTYSILDSYGKEVYSEKGNVTVTTEQIVRKNFENLNLLDGKYALILTTVYGDNVKDEFRQEFSVGNSKALQDAKNNWIWYAIVGGIVVALVIVFIIVYKIYKKRKGHSTQ